MKNLILTKTLITLVVNFLFACPNSSVLPSLEVNQQILLSSGKILAAGYVQTAKDQDLAVECYTLDGQLDRSFANNGRFVLNIPKSNEQVLQLLELRNGSIVIAGQSINYPKASLIQLQLSPDGDLNNKLCPKGYQLEVLGDGLTVPKKIVPYHSGYLIAGLVKKGGQLQQFVQAHMSNGQLLKGFALEGTLYLATNGQLKDLKVQENRNILILGNKLLKISPKGQILQQLKPQFLATNIQVTKHGFYLAGATTGSFILQEFDHSCSASNQPQHYHLPQHKSAQLKQILLKEDGQLILAGQLENSEYDHDTDWILLALTPELNPSPNFGQSGFHQLDPSLEDDELQAIYVQNEQLVVLGFSDSFDDQKAEIHLIEQCPQ